jgi:hypothetical protein
MDIPQKLKDLILTLKNDWENYREWDDYSSVQLSDTIESLVAVVTEEKKSVVINQTKDK